MVIFNSYVSLPEGIPVAILPCLEVFPLVKSTPELLTGSDGESHGLWLIFYKTNPLVPSGYVKIAMENGHL